MNPVKVDLYEGLTEITDGTVLTCVKAGPWPAEFPGVVGGDYLLKQEGGRWRLKAQGFKCPAEKDYGVSWTRFTLKSHPMTPLSVEEML